ncbi:MAG: tetratricopeptide repeat protein [Bacteroidota bacterium]
MNKKAKPVANEIKSISSNTPFNWTPVYFLVILFTFLLYANTIQHNFTVDDGTVIANNSFTKKGIDGIKDIFTHSYRAGFWDRKEGLYRPLSVAMFAIEYQIGQGSPLPGHVMNILFYMLTGIVILSVFKRLLQYHHPLLPIIATLVFIAHPIHTEVVANIKSRDEILSFLFGLTAFHFLFNYIDKNKIYWLLLSCLSFMLALFSKESSVTWIGVYPLALWFTTDKKLVEIVKLSIPYLALLILFLLIRTSILGTVTGEQEILLINNSLVGAPDKASQIATAFGILARYIGLLLIPFTLVFDYSYNTIPNITFGNPLALAGMLITIGALVYAIKELPKKSLISFAILFYLGSIALLSNLFITLEATMGERFVYTASFGYCLFFVIILDHFFKLSQTKNKSWNFHSLLKPNTVNVFLLFIVVGYSARTFARNADWKDNLTLLSHDVKLAPESARIRYAYGSALLVEKALKEKDPTLKNLYLDQSIEQLSKGVSLIPNYNDAWYNLGIAYKEKNDFKNAVYAFDQARSYKAFDTDEKLSSAGIAYGSNGQLEKAITDLKAAIALNPNSADNYNNLGLYLGENKMYDESFAAFQKALSIKPNFDKVYYNRGNIFAQQNNFRAAISNYKNALTINPSYADAYNNLGNCYAVLGVKDSSLYWFNESVKLDPSNGKAWVNLSITYRLMGDSIKANECLLKAKELGINF